MLLSRSINPAAPTLFHPKLSPYAKSYKPPRNKTLSPRSTPDNANNNVAYDTMVGGQAMGARALIEGVVRVTDLLSNETARKWAVPVIGAFTIGLTAYLILELPSSILTIPS